MNILTDMPWETVLVIIALIMLVFGLYLVSPWYPQIPALSTAVFAQVFQSANERMFLAIFYVGAPLLTLAGIATKKRRWTKTGALGLFMIYLFAALLRISTVGFTPVYWLFILGLGLIAGVARLQLKS